MGLQPLGTGKGLVARAFIKNAVSCEVVEDKVKGKSWPMEKLDAAGFFEGLLPDRDKVFKYRLRVEYAHGQIQEMYDPYGFLPTLSDEDLYLFNQGNHHRAYEKLGAQPKTCEGVWGVSFAVWAPSAQRVSVVGEFNHWDGRYHLMRSLGASGVWELFIPGLEAGVKYKFEIIGADAQLRLKADPYANFSEGPMQNASITWDLSGYEWKDNAWMEARAKKDWTKEPISVYEVHLGSWRRVVEDANRPLNYREMAHQLADYVKQMGFTHVEFMPVMEHPFLGSWGYQVTGFFAPTHRYGDPQDFMYLVDVLHQNGIGVLLDWVPAHFPRDSFALEFFDGTHLYEHADPRQGTQADWGTLVFNFGRHEVRNFLINSALAWFDRYHIDGLRVDAVAAMLYLDYSRNEGEWIPNAYGGKENIEALDFLRSVNGLVHHYYPGALMIAEESTSWSGVTRSETESGLGFDFKWNMGWMHDTLQYFEKDPIYRKFHHNQITFGMLYQYSERFVQVFSHDEVVHGKGSMLTKMSAMSIPEKSQALRALYGWMWGWPGKKCLFMGCEFGQSKEWQYDMSLDWHLLQYIDHEGIQHVVRDLNYRVGAPHEGYWREVINTDANVYGGSGQGNLGGVYSEQVPFVGRPYSLNLTLPGMSTLIFKYQGATKAK
ncbi:MAG: 1,4-alpha-glucan branching enzyme [Verrucomicrobia bacterium 21-51-4]|nr:MAG: 1,4-alpha-glucan branching enzyme [Verrucomicrobia bacterium 21-51-4]